MARNFDGVTDMRITWTMSAAAKAAFDGGGTVAVWVKPDTDGGSDLARCVDCADAAGSGWYISIEDDDGSNGRVGFSYRTSGANGHWQTNTRPLVLNSWNLIVITMDDDSQSNDPTIYVNGSSIAITETNAPNAAYVNPTADLVVGNNYASSVREWDGDISIVAIWSSILSTSKISAMWFGIHPYAIDFNDLVFCAPLGMIRDPEPEWITPANSGTVSNSPVVSDTEPPFELIETYMGG